MELRERITIIAIDDIEETMDWLKEGSIYGVMAQNFYKMAYLSSEILVDYIRDGKEPEGSGRVDNYGFDSGAMFVTMDNIDTYKAILMK